MKKFILALGLFLISATYITSEAQSISINVNIGQQPAWGPVGYDYVNYYYIPEINVYYNVPHARYYYWDRGRWISARYLPYSYRNYDLYHMYKVVINHHDPWHHNKIHVRDYGRYKGVRNQAVIYKSKDHRYRDSRKNRQPWYSDNPRNSRPEHNNRNAKVERNTSRQSTRTERKARPDNRSNRNVDTQRKNDRPSNSRNSNSQMHFVKDNQRSSSVANERVSSNRNSERSVRNTRNR